MRMRTRVAGLSVLGVLAGAAAAAAAGMTDKAGRGGGTETESEAPKVEIHGAGWIQGGRVEASWEIPDQTNDYTKNWIGQSGGALSLQSRLDDHWDCGLGLGTVMTQLARGSRGQAAKWYPFWAAWVDEARVGYTRSGEGALSFHLDLGVFPYGYHSDTKNFGQYLMHGYVYPGNLVMSRTGPLGVNPDLTGLLAQVQWRGLANDFIVNLETEDKPYYDISVADAITWKIAKGFAIGAGVNLYRVLPANEKATSPGKDCQARDLGINTGQTNQPNVCFILDSIGADAAGAAVYDTITGSLSGIKLMGRLRLDPKAWLGMESGPLGKDDLVLYSELAVLGLKDYPIYYDNILRRIPVMVGFNLPGFGYFDWSVEIQYYASKFTGDDLGAQNGVWLPSLAPSIDARRDDWKYSLNVSKIFRGHIALMGQIANDDLRLGGYHYEPAGKEAMRTPSDWYWTAKLGYFF
jgi:hypothetical protein